MPNDQETGFAAELAALIATHKGAGTDAEDLKLALDAALADLEDEEDADTGDEEQSG